MKRRRDESVVKTVVYATVCDFCGKVESGDDPAGWHYFSSSHSDWGNDSIESYEDHDVCSWPCYLNVVRKIVEEYKPGLSEISTLRVGDMDPEFVASMLRYALPRASDCR